MSRNLIQVTALLFICALLDAVPTYGNTSTLSSPNVSANALFLYRNSNFAKEDSNTTRNGFDLRETELAFYADVDPYSRLMLLLSVHPEYTYDTGAAKITQSWILEPEEAYAETNQIPNITLKFGKFKAAIGKHNLLHTHAFPFIDQPLANRVLLGEEGLNDVGVSIAALLPANWYSELTLQALRGEGENTEFKSATPNDFVTVGHWKNLWDLSEALTSELGTSYGFGRNSLRGQTRVAGLDFTVKWRPAVGGKYQSWILAGEYLDRRLEQSDRSDANVETSSGWNLWGQYQFAERWSALARYDHLKTEGSDSVLNTNAIDNRVSRKYSAAVVLNATEFSNYKLEASYTEGPTSSTSEWIERKILVQANFTIGAHPSHSY